MDAVPSVLFTCPFHHICRPATHVSCAGMQVCSLSDVSQLRPVRFSGYFQRVICTDSVCATIDKSMFVLCLKVKRRVLYPDDGLAACGVYTL